MCVSSEIVRSYQISCIINNYYISKFINVINTIPGDNSYDTPSISPSPSVFPGEAVCVAYVLELSHGGSYDYSFTFALCYSRVQ